MADPIGAAATVAELPTSPSLSPRQVFINNWAKMLGCGPNEFEITCKLINESKNFQTAVCVLFGLSLRTHKDYVVRCATYWQKNWDKESICTVEYCTIFQNHYTSEVEAYPADA